METFSLSTSINLFEEEKRLLAVTSFEGTNSVSDIIKEKNSFSVSILNYWTPENGEEHINGLNNLLGPRSENDIELHVKEVQKGGTRIELGNSGFNLAGFDHFKSEILSELKRVKYKDLEDKVYRLELTYDEIVDMLDVNYIAGSIIKNTSPVDIYEVNNINSMIKFLLHREVKLNITIDDIRLKSKLATNKTIKLIKNSFFYTTLWFAKSHSRPLGDVEGFFQLILGSYRSDKPFNITGIDKFHLKGECVDGSIAIGIREPILYSLALDKIQVIKYTKNQQSNFLKR